MVSSRIAKVFECSVILMWKEKRRLLSVKKNIDERNEYTVNYLKHVFLR